MSWVRLDDAFPDHPKVAALSDGAFRLWLGLLAYSSRYRTGGLVTASEIHRVARSRYAYRTEALRAELIGRGLLELVSLERRSGVAEPSLERRSGVAGASPAGGDPVEGDSSAESVYALHDWSDYQPSAEQAERLSQLRSEAGRRGGLRSGESRNEAKQTKQPDEPRPVPSRPVDPPPPTSSPEAGPPAALEDEGNERVAREVAAELGRRDASRAQGVKAPGRYAMACASSRWAAHRDELLALVADRPELTIRALADAIEHPATGRRLPLCAACGGRHSGLSCPFKGAQVLDGYSDLDGAP